MRLNVKSLSTLTLIAFGLLLLGCDGQGSLTGSDGTAANTQVGPPANPGGGQGSGTTAEVRVAHLSPDAPKVDVYVDKEPDEDPMIGGLEYQDFSPSASSGDYLPLESGSYDIAVTPAGETSPQAIDVDGLNLEPNKDYTILAVGELEPEGEEPGIQALPLVDNADEETALPPRDKTLVRFVHASPDAGAVDIAVDGATVLEGVTFGTASGYLEVEPGTRTVEVLKGETAVLGLDQDLEAGTKITAYVIGNASPEAGDSGLNAVTSLEATSPAGTGPVGR